MNGWPKDEESATLAVAGYIDQEALYRKQADEAAEEIMNGYAEGGLVGPPPEGRDSIPIMLSRGHTIMSYRSYKALGEKGLKELFPNTDIELILTADDVRELGPLALERLQHELDNRAGD